MLYELIAVVRTGNLAHVREIASSVGSQILASRGVIRGLSNWGQFDLPRPVTKHQNRNFQGHYFVMQFDSSVSTLDGVKRQLSLDPRMIRFSVVKVADKLGQSSENGGGDGGVESVDGQIGWKIMSTGGGDSSNSGSGDNTSGSATKQGRVQDSLRHSFLSPPGRR